jgi:PPOX class probable F420-dependent enzyme
MPLPPVAESYRPLLEEPVLGILATINAQGGPEVNPVWFLWHEEHLLLSVKGETRKYRNMRSNPNVALCIPDPASPWKYLELRGTVIDLKLYTDLSFVDLLARKYTGADFEEEGPGGVERFRVTIRVDRWTGQ